MYNNYHYIRHIRASAKCYKTRWFAVFVCCNERVTINTRSCFYPSRAVLVSKDEILCEFHAVSCFMIFIYLFILVRAGEVERLLRDYRQNQELVRNIGANYYQIIYPVQIRHHDKMGISTREVGSQKVSFAL